MTDSAPPPPPAGPNNGNPFADLGVQLGLGPMWQPTPFSWTFIDGTLHGKTAVFIMLSTVDGPRCLAIAKEDLTRFLYGFDGPNGQRVKGLVDFSGGLVLAAANEMPPGTPPG